MLETDVAFRDFQRGASEGERFHFACADQLLSMLHAQPRAAWEGFERRWRLAVGTRFLTWGELGEASSVIDRGVRAFPTDAPLRFAAGMVAEAAAVSGESRLTINVRNRAVRTREANLARAADDYRRALAIDGSFVQARLRLGRTLSLRDDAGGATRELARVIAEAGDRPTVYLAHLFLGHVFADAGDATAARREYEAAHAGNQGWPTPYVALSELLDRTGRSADARRYIAAMAARDREDNDPWWTYLLGGGGQLQPAAMWLMSEIKR